MISLFGSTFGAALPVVLGAAPLAVALLVYIYRRNGSTRDTIVSSLFLMRNLPRALPARKKFIPPPQFWLELLAFIALILAGAGLFSTTNGQHIAILIDNSFSMRASDTLGTSRFDTARELVSSQIGEGASSLHFTVFTSGSSLQRVSDIRTSGADALKVLAKIKPTFEQDRIASHIEALLSENQYDAVWVYSDHPVIPAEGETIPVRSVNIVSRNDRSQTTNLWLTDPASENTDAGSMLHVTVHSASPGPITVAVTALCWSANNGRTAAQGQGGGSATLFSPITTQVLDAASKTVTLGPSNGAWDFCQVNVVPKDPSIRDALPLDDSVWITHVDTKNEIGLVSPLSPVELGLSRLSNLTVVPSPTKPVENSGSQRPMIYHRSTLPSVGSVATQNTSGVSQTLSSATLAILPPPGPLPWGGTVSTVELKNPTITRWLSSHPLTKYANIPLLSLPVARTLVCPETAVPFMFSSDGPIACAGERAGARYIVLGFEIFPFDGVGNPTISVLTLNALKWLFQDASLQNESRPLESYSVPLGTRAALRVAPLREPMELSQAGRVAVVTPGVILFGTNPGDPVSTFIGLTAFNFVSPVESDIRTEQGVTVTRPASTAVSMVTDHKPLYEYCAWLALMVLVADLVRRIITRVRWSAR